MSPAVAKVVAQAVPAWAVQYAKRKGVPLKEAYEAIGLRVEGPMTGRPTAPANTYEQQEYDNAVNRGLPVDQESRMARAREMGFSRNLHHASGTVFAGSEMAEDARGYGIDVEDSFKAKTGGIYLSEDAGLTEEIFAGGNNPFASAASYMVDTGNEFDARKMNDAKKEELSKVLNRVVDQDDIENAAAQQGVSVENADPFEVFTDGDFFTYFGRNKQDMLMEAFKSEGYDSVTFTDNLAMGDNTVSTVVFNPNQIRSTEAAFDPEFKGSSNLLAQKGEQNGRQQENWTERDRAYFEREDVRAFIDRRIRLESDGERAFEGGRAGDGRHVWSITPELAETLEGFAPTFDVVELDAKTQAQEFMNAISEVKRTKKFGAAVHVYELEEYQQMRLFLAEDGKSGIAVKPEGYTEEGIRSLYDSLWTLEVNGEKIAGGYTASEGQMTFLNFSSITDEEFATAIDHHLNGEFTVNTGEVFAAFPQKEEYDYGSSKTEQSVEREGIDSTVGVQLLNALKTAPLFETAQSASHHDP